MRTLFITFAILLASSTLFAQNETVSYILNDGSVKTYNLNDIENVSVQQGQSAYEMKFYMKNSVPVSYFSNQFDSVKYGRDANNNYVYVFYIGANQDIYLLEDIDSISCGNIIIKENSVRIGNQTWMTKNLDVDHYRNGDPIPQVTDSVEWANLKSGAWCYRNNDPAMGAIYGKLYNWYAIDDPRGLSPLGWHVPATEDWETLIIYLGGENSAQEKLKEAGTAHWQSPNKATNESGFSALPGGHRSWQGLFLDSTNSGSDFWSSSTIFESCDFLNFFYRKHPLFVNGGHSKVTGMYVRCVTDYTVIDNRPNILSINRSSVNRGDDLIISGYNFGYIQGNSFVMFNNTLAEVTDYSNWTNNSISLKVPANASSGLVSVTVNGEISNEVYITIMSSEPGSNDSVIIGSQIWKKKNLDVDRYRNGDPIPQVTDSAEWASLKTGAWCYYNNDSAMGAIYGKLYNWYAVNDPRGLAPAGWHIPTDDEWTKLSIFLGDSVAGGKLKEAGTERWRSPNIGGTNESGFSALPGGFRGFNSDYIRNFGFWWSSSSREDILEDAWMRVLNYTTRYYSRLVSDKALGMSVRCVKD